MQSRCGNGDGGQMVIAYLLNGMHAQRTPNSVPEVDMLRQPLAGLAFLACITSIACSDQSPVTPPAVSDAQVASARIPATPGCYTLSFSSRGQPVTTLVAGTAELNLLAHVDNCAGTPADRGSVTFQYCSYKGLPPNDITRADEAPASACAAGTAKWANLLSVSVNSSGDAGMNFGVVIIPRTVGFRFKYSVQGGSIASGVSSPVDFTWT